MELINIFKIENNIGFEFDAHNFELLEFFNMLEAKPSTIHRCFILPEGLTANLCIQTLLEIPTLYCSISDEVNLLLKRHNPEQKEAGLDQIFKEIGYTPVFPLKDHQKEAVEKLITKPHFALFHDPGLGKTKTILDMFVVRRAREKGLKMLVLCPNFLVLNWVEEVKIHAPFLSIVPLYDGTKKKIKGLEQEADIYVTNIEGFASKSYSEEYIGRDGEVKVRKVKNKKFQEAILRFVIDRKFTCVIDESTTIKTPTSKTTKCCLKMKELFQYRYILTGTPVPKNLLDIWSQLSFLDDNATGFDVFNNFKSFHFVFSGKWGEKLERIRYEDQLYRRISKYVDVKKKEECYDLPEKIYKRTYVDLLPMQRRQYDELIKKCQTEFITKQAKCIKIEKTHALSKAQTLMQVCKGFFFSEEVDLSDMENIKVVKKENIIPCAKYQILKEMLETEYKNSKCIIWTTHIPERNQLMSFLTANKIKFECLIPGYSKEEIAKRIKRFQAGEIQYLICSLQSFNKGITLTTAEVEIFFSNSYNWEMRAQAEDRTHRIGTAKSPIYHDIITRNTIEELIIENLTSKGDFANTFIKEITK